MITKVKNIGEINVGDTHVTETHEIIVTDIHVTHINTSSPTIWVEYSWAQLSDKTKNGIESNIIEHFMKMI